MFIPLTVIVVILGAFFVTVLLRVIRNSAYTYLSPAAYDDKLREIEAARSKELEAANTQLEIDKVEESYKATMGIYRIRREHGKGIGMGAR